MNRARGSVLGWTAACVGALFALAAMVPLGPASATARLIGRGTVSTPDDEFGGSETSDGSTLFFDRSVPRSYTYYICISHRRQDGSWGRAEVAPFSGTWRDSDPMLSLSGKRLYFVSDRPNGSGAKHDFDIWYVEKTAHGWSAKAINLGAPVNGPANEYFVSEAADGTIYFSAARERNLGAIDVWRSARNPDGTFAQPQNLGPRINGKGITNLEVLIAPDQSFMILSSFGREKDIGNSNLYVSRRVGGEWQAPQGLSSEINTNAREYSPRFSADGTKLIFASERGVPTEAQTKPWTYDELARRSRGVLNGLGNLYEIPLADEGLPNVDLRAAGPAQ